ncbi:MAG: ribonuclease HII [Gammaproteobacteria bacterium]|nr:ribonuclease HII [Gammaproteobacteria bacterium]
MSFIIGVDEVGRGPLAGPVITCAVLWPDDQCISQLDDSKKLSAKRREALVPLIRKKALKISYGRAEVEEIDALNILQATMLAMERAVHGLGDLDEKIQIDGNRIPDSLRGRAEAVIGGDGLVSAISAASILAKVARDEEMVALSEIYPGYGLEAHLGYPTKLHIEALEILGVTPIHRRSFGPVRRMLEGA